VQQTCNGAASFYLANEPPERVCRVGVPVSVDVQVAFNCDTDARVSETLAYDFNRNARLSAKARVSVPQSRPLNAVENGPPEVPRVNRRAVRMRED
jgi:hypothetical protein